MPSSPRCFALVPCAGVGTRAATAGRKQYANLAGRPVVAHTLDALASVPRLARTLVVLAPDDDEFEGHVPAFGGWVSRRGGATRAATVAAGLDALRREHGVDDRDWVLVHDAARCLLQPAWVDRLIDACRNDEVGGLLALPLADTLKVAAVNSTAFNAAPDRGAVHRVVATVDRGAVNRVVATLERGDKWLAQTPQMFRLGLLQRALASAADAGIAVTDEASAVEAGGHAPLLVAGEIENFKLTWPTDFALAARLLQSR